VIGWPWHQIQQRNAYAGTISQRARDVAEMYNSTDLERTRQLLKLYQVEYVVVGELERAYYTAEGIKKFELLVQKGLALLAFDGEGMNIYRII
jgi:uncharacterized membrane protein